MDSSLGFICAEFAASFLKVSKYINTEQIAAIPDVDLPSNSRLFLYQRKQIAMLQQNLTSDQIPVKIMQLSLVVNNSPLSKRNDREENTCKHRNENGWCSKSQRQCLSLTDLFLKH